MARQSQEQSLREELTCAICFDLFRNPVMLDCMHHFCQECIQGYWNSCSRVPTCPQCRQEFPTRSFRHQYLVSGVVEKVRRCSSEEYRRTMQKHLQEALQSYQTEREKVMRLRHETEDNICNLMHRKPSEAKRISLQEDWNKTYRLHEKSWEKLEQLYNMHKDGIPLRKLHSLIGEINELSRQWENYKCCLANIQSELRDQDLEMVIRSVQTVNNERKERLQSLRDSLHLAAQRISSRASKKTLSMEPSQGSAAPQVDTNVSEKSSIPSGHTLVPRHSQEAAPKEISPQPPKQAPSRANSSVSQGSAASHLSRSSWASRVENLATQVLLHKEELAAAQASLALLQQEKEEAEKTARAAALQAEAAAAALIYEPAKLQEGSSFGSAESCVDDQSARGYKQNGTVQPNAKPSANQDSLGNHIRSPTKPKAEALQQVGTPETASHGFNPEAREFQSGPQTKLKTDCAPSGHSQLAQEQGEQTPYMSWEDAFLLKHSVRESSALGEPRETFSCSPTEATLHSVPPSLGYDSHAAPADDSAPQRKGRGYSPWREGLDLASWGVQKFSDKPGHDYLLWKQIFKNTIQREELLPTEELRLMITWLGPASELIVKDIYSVQLGSPATALSLAWDMLDQQYGTPALIEFSLLDRISELPDIDISEPHKLWEFSAILTQLRTAQKDPTLPGLACLNQFSTQKDIVQKLPMQLVEKWIELSAVYRERNAGKEPPFAALEEFANRQTKLYNEPQALSLREKWLPANKRGSRASGPTRSPVGSVKGNAYVSVHKTEVTTSPKKMMEEQLSEKVQYKQRMRKNQICPLHKSSHTLNKCREFGKKPLDERKALIKEYRICFKCCEATDHMAKMCTVKVQCHLCKSDKHPGALHPHHGLPQRSPAYPSTEEPNMTLRHTHRKL